MIEATSDTEIAMYRKWSFQLIFPGRDHPQRHTG